MMKKLSLFLALSATLFADNQTGVISSIQPQASLPYTVELTQADFELPVGLHSFAAAFYGDTWLIIGGRMNGLHGFELDDSNFPPDQQNGSIYVVDSLKKKSYVRPLDIDQELIDTLSVTNPQYYQKGNTLYITGGYGVISATGEFSTKDTLTAVDIPGLIRWTKHEVPHTAQRYLRQVHNSALQVTGGEMTQIGDGPTLLVFGQNFAGFYQNDVVNGDYTRQVRRFWIDDDGKTLAVRLEAPIPLTPDPNYRRRDLNVVPIMERRDGRDAPALMAYSGVFTETVGAWTVPVRILPDGSSQMEDPNSILSLKQGMNNYVCPTLGLYSKTHRDMYTLFFGGLSFGYFDDGIFMTDSEFPFINQITTIKRNRQNIQTQYIMDGTYPVILSRQSNPGNQLLFGTGAMFFAKTGIPIYENGVIKFDELPKGKTHVGYIVGGIQSTMPNTDTQSDSAASPYIFKVNVIKK